MALDLDLDISLLIDAIERRFVLSDEPISLSGLERNLGSLLKLVETYSDAIPQSTAVRVHAVAEREALLAESMLDVEGKAAMLDQSLHSEIRSILNADMNVNECKDGHLPQTVRGFLTRQWLLSNLHYPYPSASVKAKLSKQTGSSIKAVDDWFANARRKIGWTAFSKRYFKGNRSLTLDCAYHIFIKGNEGDTYCKEIVRDLEEIRSAAARLCGDCSGRDWNEPSVCAKELETITVHKDVVDISWKRRSSASSMSKERSSTSCSTTSTVSLRKRSRASSEESDATLYADENSYRPLKRARNASASSSSMSRASSITACSSESEEQFNESVTSSSSPTFSNIPLEFFNGWMDDLSAESSFLPHDLAGKPSLSVLSQKRASTESELGSPSKRARIEEPLSSLVGADKFHHAKSHSGGLATQPVSLSAPDDHFPLLSGTVTNMVLAELDNEEVNRIIAQLDFNIPEAPVSEWDASLLSGGLETSLFDLSSFGVEIDPSSGLQDDLNVLLSSISAPDASLSVAKEAQVVPYVPQYDGAYAQSHCFEPSSTNADNNTNGPSVPSHYAGSIPLSLSSLDFDFLEALGNAPQPVVPDVQSTLSSSADSAASLVEIGSSSEADELMHDDSDRAKKLGRLDQLLVEAQKLQQEVFG